VGHMTHPPTSQIKSKTHKVRPETKLNKSLSNPKPG